MKEFTANVLSFIDDLIDEGDLQAHSKLPSERDLIKAFSTSRITLREALVNLENLGKIYRRNRHGWFVAPPRYVINPAQKSNFNQFAAQQGLDPSTQVLFVTRVAADRAVAKALQLKGKKYVYHLRRVRFVGARPILLEDIYLDAKRFSGIDSFDLSNSLTKLLKDEYSVEIETENNTIAMDVLDQDRASALEVYAGAPCIKFLRSRFDQEDVPAEYDVEWYLHNSIQMNVSSQ